MSKDNPTNPGPSFWHQQPGQTPQAVTSAQTTTSTSANSSSNNNGGRPPRYPIGHVISLRVVVGPGAETDGGGGGLSPRFGGPKSP